MPEQLMSMVTKIKEATIDVGPQPVKYSKFIQVPLYQLAKLIPEEQLQQFKQSLEESKDGSLGARHQSNNLNKNECQGGSIPNTKVNCLIISTDIAFEIWLIKHQSLISGQMDIECIYRKKEDGIDLIDYLHLIETNQNIVDHNQTLNSFMKNLD